MLLLAIIVTSLLISYPPRKVNVTKPHPGVPLETRQSTPTRFITYQIELGLDITVRLLLNFENMAAPLAPR